ncbi:hypothetical protein GGX14DRAFT_696767 [Mycena pura]|uniref:NmrA-like domain-containing protein n=1 Tax=Mycena pura TaxID=153505 RepID=A0AAD6VRB7_9AGAR|nr:hypothetical protein GGX14DRAFT_696767 [Mycena pura]
MSSRIVSVFGATGDQGSAVIRALLKDGTFTPRAITRDTQSEASKKLKAQGVEVVEADSLDKVSLKNALQGSEAVFAVTFPIFPMKADGDGPMDQTIGVKFFLWSGMPSISKISNGKYTNCLHYDHKAEVQEYLKSSGLPNATIYLGAFLENYWKFGQLKKTDTGYVVAIPSYKVGERQAFTWVERDVPAAVLALLKNYNDPSKNISGKSTGKALGVELTFTTAPPMGMAAMNEMFTALAEYSGLYTATPVPNPDLVALGVQFGTIEEWLEAEVKPRFGPFGQK